MHPTPTKHKKKQGYRQGGAEHRRLFFFVAIKKLASMRVFCVVGLVGFEPTTSCTPCKRATNCAIARIGIMNAASSVNNGVAINKDPMMGRNGYALMVQKQKSPDGVVMGLCDYSFPLISRRWFRCERLGEMPPSRSMRTSSARFTRNAESSAAIRQRPLRRASTRERISI